TDHCLRSVVARHRLDGVDHLLVGDLFRGAEEGGVAPVHQQGPAVVGVTAEGGNELPPFRVVEGTEVHGVLLMEMMKRTTGRRQFWDASSARSRYTPWSTRTSRKSAASVWPS